MRISHLLAISFLIATSAKAASQYPHKWACNLLLAEISLNSSIAKYSEVHHPKVFQKLLQLRNLPRSGWLKRGIPKESAENVFLHTIKLARAAELLSENNPQIDGQRLLRMILVHDLGELGKIGDVTPSDGISREQKATGELEALYEFRAEDPDAFSEVIELWHEFEAQQTTEAILAFQLDKIDAGIQAIRYEKQGFSTADFYPYVKERISDPFLAKVFDLVLATRFNDEDPYVVYFKLLAQGSQRLTETE